MNLISNKFAGSRDRLKSNLTLAIDTKVLEKFNKVKGNSKVSHLVQDWLIIFIENKKKVVPKNNLHGLTSDKTPTMEERRSLS